MDVRRGGEPSAVDETRRKRIQWGAGMCVEYRATISKVDTYQAQVILARKSSRLPVSPPDEMCALWSVLILLHVRGMYELVVILGYVWYWYYCRAIARLPVVLSLFFFCVSGRRWGGGTADLACRGLCGRTAPTSLVV